MNRLSTLPRLLATVFVAMALLSVLAQVAFADPLDDGVRRVGKLLQCPICAGASVADSPSDLAGQMRGVIRVKLQAGESDQQIVDYFIERYGDSVLIEPPRRGISLLVWLAPVIMLIVGGVLLWRLLRSWIGPRTANATAPLGRPTPAYQNGTTHGADDAATSSVDRARVELDRYRREA